MLRDADRRSAAVRGMSEEELERQIRLLEGPARRTEILRPCTLGDGLTAIPPEDHEGVLEHHERAAAAGRCRKFIPASGAATRMFADLLHYLNAEEPPEPEALADSSGPAARTLRTFLERLEDFPFRDGLLERLEDSGGAARPLGSTRPIRRILEQLLGPQGLDLAGLPKGLLPFHRYPEGVRTPFEEHLVEAADFVRDRGGISRVHLTISGPHEPLFRALLAAGGSSLEGRLGTRFDVTFSEQSPATDTIALEPGGDLFRTARGELLFRASGHGALLWNLGALGGDLVLIKNVDNVAPDPLKPPTSLWSRLLLGTLARLQQRVHEVCDVLDRDPGQEGALQAGEALCRELHRQPSPGSGEAAREALLRALDRPLRVCGMVPNEGEPGGGPFWVAGPEGPTLQIVEGAGIDPDSPEQARRFAAGTHFNPVFLACGLRDHRGGPFDLDRFVDPEAVLIARKSHEGRDLLALERPGLWNGAMAFWNTVFVEVPVTVFNPVKTVLDLLRPQHLAGEGDRR